MSAQLIVAYMTRPRGAAPLVLAAVALLPIALVLAGSARWRDRGPTWSELLLPLWMGHRNRPRAQSYEFGWPVRRSIDRLYALLVTEANDVLLIRHDRHDRRPYHTLPGGTIRSKDERPEDTVAAYVGERLVYKVEGWSLIHVERRAGRQELVFGARLAAQHLDAARTATRHHFQTVPLTPEGLAELDLHPHGVAEVIRRVAARSADPA